MRQVKFPKISLTLSKQVGNKCSKCGALEVKPELQTAQGLLSGALLACFDNRGQTVSPTMEHLEERMPLRAKIVAANGSVLLEQSEWEVLCSAIGKPYRWSWTHEDVLKVCHAVTEAEEVAVEAKPNRAQRREEAKD